jgi:hypothetical protein
MTVRVARHVRIAYASRVPSYEVLIDDNFHYQDESERVSHGVFATADEALAACRSIVDGFLTDAFKPDMSPDALYKYYMGFGDDPFVVPVDPKDASVRFSAWEYAKERCAVIAGSAVTG